MQLEVPGLAGTYTSSADRKLEEGQKVGYSLTFTSLFFLLCECVNSDLFIFVQQNLRQLRLDLQRLGTDLQSGERACCRNTGGEKLRQALTAADETLAKQVQVHLKFTPKVSSLMVNKAINHCLFCFGSYVFLNANVILKALFPSPFSTNNFGAQPALKIKSSYLTVNTSRYLQMHVPASLVSLPPSPSLALFNPH